jgi:hypothetical protein
MEGNSKDMERIKETAAKQSEEQVEPKSLARSLTYDADGAEWLKIDSGDFLNSIDLRIALFRFNDPVTSSV